ncbi:MAG: glucosyl-3-phosphoglycerate synthase, partial [Jatrophihabitans endophyticus]
MDERVAAWFAAATTHWRDWDAAALAAAKGTHRVSVVLPAHDEQATIGPIVEGIRRDLVDAVGLVDELVVID